MALPTMDEVLKRQQKPSGKSKLPTMDEVASRQASPPKSKGKLPTMDEVLKRSAKPEKKKTFLEALTTWPRTVPLDPNNPEDEAELRRRQEGTATSGVGKFVERTGQSGVESMFLSRNPYKTSTGNKVADVAADITGGIMGLAANPKSGLNAGANIAKYSTKVAEKAIGKLAPKALTVGRGIPGAAITNTAGMVPFTAAEVVVNNEMPTRDQLLLNAGLGVLMGAGGKAAEPVLAKGASKLGNLLEGLAGKRGRVAQVGEPPVNSAPAANVPAQEMPIQQPVPGVRTPVSIPKPFPQGSPQLRPLVTGNKFPGAKLVDNPQINDLRTEIARVDKDLDGAINAVAKSGKLNEPNLHQQILKTYGGIKPSPGVMRGEYKEQIPIGLRNNNGYPLDQIADEMGMTASELLNKITGETSYKRGVDLKGDAMGTVLKDENYAAMAKYRDDLARELEGMTGEKQNYWLGQEVKQDQIDFTKTITGKPFTAELHRGEVKGRRDPSQSLNPRVVSLDGLTGKPQGPARSLKGALELKPVQPTPPAAGAPTATPEQLSPLQQALADAQAKAKQTAADGTEQRGFINTLQESVKPTDEIKTGLLADLRSRYTPISNQETVARANRRIEKDIEAAANYVSSAKKYTPEHVATAHRLIDEFQKSGQVSRAVDIAEKLAEQGTKAGQSIQAFSIYNRLSPEGILVHASRIVARANERLPIGAEPAKITEDIAAKLTDLSATMQTMNVAKEKANRVIDIVSRAQKGEKLTEAETAVIKDFITEASKFVGKVKPFKPKPVKEVSPRVRDNVVRFFDKQEQDALKRIMERKNRVSSTPLDLYADYVIVGTSRLAKGAVKFSDWAESMVRDLGEEVRPHLEDVYNKAVDKFNLSAKAISHQRLSEVERITNRVIKSKALAPEDADALRKIAEQVAGLSGEARVTASQDLQAILQAFERPTIGTKISMIQTIAQLLNPKTTVRNALGNELFYRFERLNKMVAAPIDWARVKLTGGQREVAFVANVPLQGEYWKNWLTGWRAGLRGVNPEGLTTQYDLRPQTFSNKWNPLNYLEKLTGATLKSFDFAAYKRGVAASLTEMAHLDAMRLGLKGDVAKEHVERFIRSADENILGIADQYGKYVTFQDNNLISTGMVKLKRGLNLGKNFGFGDLILKYPKTPGNLLMRAIEYSPAGFLRSVYILAAPIWKAQPNTAEVINALSRAIIGTVGLTGLGYFLANKGILTGSRAKDKDVRELQTAAGQGQYRVNVTALRRWVLSGFNPEQADPQQNDNLISYDWAQPVAVSLSMGANAQTERRTAKNKMSGLYNIAQGGLNTLTEQSLLQGLQRAFEAYPGREGVLDKAVDIGVTLPASFVPTLVSQVNQVTDNAKRLIGPVPPKQEAANLLKAKVPGLAQGLPIDYTTLGKPKEKFQGGSNSLFNVFLNPSFVSKYRPSPEAKLVIDLMNRTGDTMVAPRRPSSSIVINGQRRKLSLEQVSRLQLLVGQETSKRLRGIDPNLNDKRKTKAILWALDIAGKKGRDQLKKEIKEGR